MQEDVRARACVLDQDSVHGDNLGWVFLPFALVFMLPAMLVFNREAASRGCTPADDVMILITQTG